MIVSCGKKRSLQALQGIEVEVISNLDEGVREDQQQWMAKFRSEILDLEDLIPWHSVTKSWKVKRSSWRKRVVQSLTLQDIGELLKELLRCLVWNKDKNGQSILKWENEIDGMSNDVRDCKKFSLLWKRLSCEIQKWIPHSATNRQLPDGSSSRRKAEVAIKRLKEANKVGNLDEVPLDAILQSDLSAMAHLKSLAQAERKPNVTSTTVVEERDRE